MLTKKEAAQKRQLDRKIFGGKLLTRKEISRALELKRKSDFAREQAAKAAN